MECEKKSKGILKELINSEELADYKLHQLETFLGLLEAIILERTKNSIAYQNFITIYEYLEKRKIIDLTSFQPAYQEACEKQKRQ